MTAPLVVELKPRPFCGNPDPRIDEAASGFPCILCGECGASTDYMSGPSEYEQAVAAWNRRAP